ncbi:MDR family oxidoreductase [soil metagenome]
MRALLLTQPSDGGAYTAALTEVDASGLPDAEVTIDIAHSSLNYKDGLAVTGTGKIVRGDFPFVPGIDLAGTVTRSDSDEWSSGERVVLTGWGTGEERWGGFAEQARAHPDHLVRLPDDLSTEQAMAIGTAGFTAMLAVMSIEEYVQEGRVAVSGATGGVGSFAVAFLASRGYEVVAATGKADAGDYLRSLGAAEVVNRDEWSGKSRPMEKAKWAGAVDTVGGPTLAHLIAAADRHGVVAACGNAASHSLETTVFPFILRGVTLAGIDSNTCEPEQRKAAWGLIAEEVANGVLDRVDWKTIRLDEVIEYSARIVEGKVRGRVVVDVRA